MSLPRLHEVTALEVLKTLANYVADSGSVAVPTLHYSNRDEYPLRSIPRLLGPTERQQSSDAPPRHSARRHSSPRRCGMNFFHGWESDGPIDKNWVPTKKPAGLCVCALDRFWAALPIRNSPPAGSHRGAARTRKTHQRASGASLNHLVGSSQQRLRDGEAEGFGGLGVQRHFEFDGQLNGKV